jgi:ubiquinone/menaquinone biosynthesis C-methylase UbiE
VAMLAQNFPIPHHVYKVLPNFSGDVLQVGCGTGLLNKHLRRRTDINFTNLDPNGYALNVGVKMKRFATCVQGFIDKATPFSAESFDVVLFARSFHHVRHHRKAFQECSRILRRGGVIIIADPVVLKSQARDFSDGYMANSSIDGVIWRFTQDSFVQHISNVLPPSLKLASVTCVRQLHVTNYNLFVPQTDIVAVIEKGKL